MKREAIVGLKMFMFIKAVSDTLFNMINAVYRGRPLIFIGATFREKLLIVVA